MALRAINQRDYWPTTEWRTASPESQGMSSTALAEVQTFGEDPDSVLTGVAVVRHGYLVYERYFQNFHAGSYQTLNSITKSVVSTLVGIATGRGLIPSIDEPISTWFPEMATLDLDPRSRQITLRHLLTMTGGWSHDEYPIDRFATDQDVVRGSLRRAIAHEPGTSFWYDNQGAHLVSILLSRAAGMSTPAFAQEALLGPLGIWTDDTPRAVWRTKQGGQHRWHRFANWDEQSGLPWKVDALGHAAGYAGLHFTVREMAKFGYLWLNNGVWDGDQIVPEDYVAAATKPQSMGGKPGEANYGYLWWTLAADPHGTYFGLGAGGQYLFVSPELDLIAAVASSGSGLGGRHGDCRTRDIFDRLIVPAVVD
jgi:CubicO group peptidase (beta-lactamase class C family)